MKLILNIVAKDVRRLRWAVMAVWAVTAAKFGFGWWLLLHGPTDLAVWRNFPRLVVALVALEAVLAWLVTGLLVLEDPLVGTEPAWRTRPIAGRRLLAAKVMGAGVMLCGPVVVFGLPWWWFNGFGLGDIGPALAGGLALQLLVIVPSMFVASLVDNIGRFVVWSVVGVALTLTYPLVWAVVLTQRLPRGSDAWGFVVLAIVAAGMVATVVGQFRCGVRRRFLVGGALVAAGCLMVVGYQMVGRALAEAANGWTMRNEARVADLQLTRKFTTVGDEITGARKGSQVFSQLIAKGMPSGTAVDLVSAEHEWTWAGGARVTQASWGWQTSGLRPEMLGWPAAKLDEETVQWQEMKRLARANRPGPQPRVPPPAVPGLPVEMPVSASVTVARSVGGRLQAEDSRYVIRANLRIVKPQVWGALPLTAEARGAARGYWWRIVEMQTWARGGEFKLIQSHPAWAEFSLSEWQYWLTRPRAPDYYAVDRERGRVNWISGDHSETVILAGVMVNARSASLRAPQVVRNGEWTVVERDWQQRLELVLIGWDEVARIRREVQTEPFRANRPGVEEAP